MTDAKSVAATAANDDNKYTMLLEATKLFVGTIDFADFAKAMNVGNAEAMRKRFKRFLEKEAPGVVVKGNTIGDPDTTTTTTAANPRSSGTTENANTPKTPKSAGRKRKVKEAEDESNQNEAGAEEEDDDNDAEEANKKRSKNTPAKAPKSPKTPKTPRVPKSPRKPKTPKNAKNAETENENDEEIGESSSTAADENPKVNDKDVKKVAHANTKGDGDDPELANMDEEMIDAKVNGADNNDE